MREKTLRESVSVVNNPYGTFLVAAEPRCPLRSQICFSYRSLVSQNITTGVLPPAFPLAPIGLQGP